MEREPEAIEYSTLPAYERSGRRVQRQIVGNNHSIDSHVPIQRDSVAGAPCLLSAINANHNPAKVVVIASKSYASIQGTPHVLDRCTVL